MNGLEYCRSNISVAGKFLSYTKEIPGDNTLTKNFKHLHLYPHAIETKIEWEDLQVGLASA